MLKETDGDNKVLLSAGDITLNDASHPSDIPDRDAVAPPDPGGHCQPAAPGDQSYRRQLRFA
jgi:hypothetical protein